MSRIVGVINPNPSNPLIQQAFSRDQSRAGKILQVTRAGGLVPEAYSAWTNMYDTVHRLNSVPAKIKALASLLVYMRVGCVMCLDFSTVSSRMTGVTEEKLMALQKYKTSRLFSDEECAVLRLAEAMTRTPAIVEEDEFDAVRQFYNDSQLMELTFHITVTNMGGRIGRGLDLLPEGFSKGQFCVFPVRE
jgi:alkylhydroperoxidase family enzyme